MKKKDPSRQRWERLSRDEQFTIASAVARRRAKSLRGRFPTVAGVGAGLRTKAGKLRKSEAICLLFTVSPGEKGRFREEVDRAIPADIVVSLTRRGRRAKYCIPTDVLDLAVGFH